MKSSGPEDVHGHDPSRVVVEKRLPALRRRAPAAGHVFGDGGLSDLDAQLEQLTVMRGAPQSGLAMHISRMSLRMSPSMAGRPPTERDFQRQ